MTPRPAIQERETRSSRILTAWRLWRATSLIRASQAAFDAGHPQRSRALLDRAGAVLRKLPNRSEGAHA